MLHRLRLSILLQGLTLLLLGPGVGAASLGLTVHVVPLGSDGGKTVRAHFTAIAPTPCPALSGLCGAGEDCLVHTTSFPFNGTKPKPGWCVRQWQKTVPSNYQASISLGSNTQFYVSMKTGPKVRANSRRLNQPAFVALPPPLRARVNCPHHFFLSARDLDGDKVRCRFARADQGECLSCTQHSFLELNQEKCMLTFTGKAPAGQYFIFLMAEDFIPVPKTVHLTDNKPLSSVPVHLSLTVEESTSRCSDEPLAGGQTPKEDSTLFVLPFQEVKFDVSFMSQQESVVEVAVVGPPKLFRTGFKSIGPLSMLTMAWVRSENNLAHLLPVCFVANTYSLQSEPRCVWLYQREMRKLPDGTELKCEKTAMTLVLPISSLSNIRLDELQLNSPTCPVTYNSTHLNAHISLTGCGTKTVHSGSELVYTNTLQSVRPYTMVSRQPSLVLPLACRIPGAQVKGPHTKIDMPTENETFGQFRIWLEFHFPGEGPLAKFTDKAKLRSISTRRIRREAELPSGSNIISSSSSNSTSTRKGIGSRIEQLDLHVMSDCTIDRAEMIVSNCLESPTEDFAEARPILKLGCLASSSIFEVITTQSNSKIYRLDLSNLEIKETKMYIQCKVNLCFATLPSLKCPDLCARSISNTDLVNSVFSRTYTIHSGPISLVVTTPAPSTTVRAAATSATTNIVSVTSASAAQSTTTSRAPEQASSLAAGVILTTVSIFLQNLFLH